MITPLPQIAIVIPAYNAGKTLLETMESAKSAIYYVGAQGLQIVAEIIVVDDCSSDDTAQVAALYRRDHVFVKLYQTPQNSGAGFARNLGVAKTEADLIFFLDADDLFRPEHVLACTALLLARPDLDYVRGGIEIEAPIHESWIRPLASTLPSNLCIRKEAHLRVGGFPQSPEFRGGGEDAYYSLLIEKALKGFLLEKKTVYYRLSPGNCFDRQLEKFQKPAPLALAGETFDANLESAFRERVKLLGS